MASACGKIILLGEHAVVYGTPAIAAGIDRGAEATAAPAARASIHLGDEHVVAGDGTDTARAYAALLEALGAAPCETRVTLNQPAGVGLGASAAIAVAVARAVLVADGRDPTNVARVLEAATAWERVFHGNPSGIDTAAAAHGGCVYFTRAGGPEPITLGDDLRVAVAVAGPAASTKSMVEGVARLRDRKPELVNKALEGIAALVKNARLCLEAGDVHGLGKLLDLNQMLLSGLFVSTDDVERACATAREAGALGAKLTGAGGGGAVIALVEDDAAPVLDAWRAGGFECFACRVSSRGSSP